MAKVGLLIGVSEYEESGFNPLPSAHKDIEAMQRVLKDPELGDFDEIKTLLNPSPYVFQYEVELLFANCNKDDLVLFFFSGHGIKDLRNNLYFATPITHKNSKEELVRSTAVPARFVHEMMSNSRAKRQAIILDCCFSGAFDPSLQAKDDGSLDLEGQLGAEGRVVLASSSSTQYSFGQQDFELSIYTHYLIEGIETGAGDLNKDGQISILELHEYATEKVQEEIPNSTPKLIVLRDKGFEIILSKTKSTTTQLPTKNDRKIELNKVEIEISNRAEGILAYNSVPSLLESLIPFIDRLVEQFKSKSISRNLFNDLPEKDSETQNFILDSIRIASGADFVFVMRGSQGTHGWSLSSQSTLSEEIEELSYTQVIRKNILSGISIESIFDVEHHGIYKIYYDEQSRTSKLFVLVPLNSLDDVEFMVVCGLPEGSYLLNDAYVKIVASFYRNSHQLPFQSSRIEAAILDDLKRSYSYLPLVLYNKRFDLFCDRFSQIVMYFEPILDLDTISISGWEALARDKDSLSAPVDLFTAAELWGRRFTVELDHRLLTLAVTSYRDARIESKQNRPHEILPLSVNVYPESLMRTKYFETVREVIQEGKGNLIPAKKLILEISEKANLPEYQNGLRLDSPLDAFKARLADYQKLKIKFGIDDFGVGYASVSRLSGLSLPYIKIDREILYQQPAALIINFVHQMVVEANPFNPASVIVEGLDEDSPIKLSDLKEMGVSYVQGYIVGKAGSKINRLSTEKYEFLRKSIYG